MVEMGTERREEMEEGRKGSRAPSYKYGMVVAFMNLQSQGLRRLPHIGCVCPAVSYG